MYRKISSLSAQKPILTSINAVVPPSLYDTPRNNNLLSALPRAGYERLLPHLEHVSLSSGSILYGAGERQDYLYFITSGIVSRTYMTDDGMSTEYAVKGAEGVVGIASFLGGNSTTSQAAVMSSGYAFRIRAELIKKEMVGNGELLHLLLKYTQSVISQIAQISMCYRNHSVQQQLCRWILSRLDRMPSNEMSATHELIAYSLGVRREGITQAAVKLQERDILHYRRGYITVVDRPQLQKHSCECHMAIIQEYNRLFRPETSRRQH